MKRPSYHRSSLQPASPAPDRLASSPSPVANAYDWPSSMVAEASSYMASSIVCEDSPTSPLSNRQRLRSWIVRTASYSAGSTTIPVGIGSLPVRFSPPSLLDELLDVFPHMKLRSTINSGTRQYMGSSFSYSTCSSVAVELPLLEIPLLQVSKPSVCINRTRESKREMIITTREALRESKREIINAAKCII